jgi:hypothetical protein
MEVGSKLATPDTADFGPYKVTAWRLDHGNVQVLVTCGTWDMEERTKSFPGGTPDTEKTWRAYAYRQAVEVMALWAEKLREGRLEAAFADAVTEFRDTDPARLVEAIAGIKAADPAAQPATAVDDATRADLRTLERSGAADLVTTVLRVTGWTLTALVKDLNHYGRVSYTTAWRWKHGQGTPKGAGHRERLDVLSFPNIKTCGCTGTGWRWTGLQDQYICCVGCNPAGNVPNPRTA